MATILRRMLESVTAQVVALVMVFAWLVVTVIVQIQVLHYSHQTRDLVTTERAFTTCVADWANRYTTRTERLTSVNNAHNDAQVRLSNATQLVFTSVANQPFDIARFKAALNAEQKAWRDYQAASEALTEANNRNPIPNPPQFTCDGF
jgi:hypothetical protein